LSDHPHRDCTRTARENLLVCRLHVTAARLTSSLGPAGPAPREKSAGRTPPRTRTPGWSSKSLSPEVCHQQA
jgi:hypothetical protein